MWVNFSSVAAPYPFPPDRWSKSATAAKPASPGVIRRTKSIERLLVNEVAFGTGPDAMCSDLACPIQRDGAVSADPYSRVFTGALGFRIGGVPLMPSRLILADARMIGAGRRKSR